ncbi:hypothetical protein BG57_13975 [Caballeronia grimmiae]|uniref:Uncharacterized protein n=1 Tax=Caballeronia grimmiae TaxID=1071679 RepID=A0A069NRQ6_9BURK|nr:hypothetical protein BG57_13975 [Caballeronia grimmiae]GGD94996.1 hypothetical protein GCM10010985_57090 [Caballeronia grimmiae]
MPDRDVDNKLGARARIVEFVFLAVAYDITIGTTMADDRVCAPQLGGPLRLASRPSNPIWFVKAVTQEHFGVCKRMLTKKQHGSPIQ